MCFRIFILCLVFCVVVVECRHTRLLRHARDVPQDAVNLPPTGNLIEFLSVEKSLTVENKNTFRLRFRKNRQELKLEYFDFITPLPKSGSEGQEEDNISTFTFSAEVVKHSDAVFSVSTLDKSARIMFILRNSNGGAARQDAIQMPEFVVLPAGDIIYQPNHDAQFKVYVTKGTETSDQWPDPLHVYFHVLDATIGEFKSVYDFDSLAEATRRELAGGINETTVTVKTSEHQITGLMDVHYSSRGEPGDLVAEIVVSKGVVLRPSVLPNAFPDGYVGFVPKEQEYCEVGADCIVSCVAVGNSVSSIYVYEIIDGDSQVQVTNTTESVDHYPYSLQVTWDLSSTDQSLAGEVRRFHCQAEDAEHHTDASLVTAVEYRLVVVIDEDRSNVALQANGNITDAVLTCAVSGYPRPNMTFNLEYEYAHFSGVAPDEIITEGKNEFLMLKEVTFHPDESHGGYFHTPTGDLRSATCETFQPGTYTSSSYQLPFENIYT
ncbi:hypothetical protein RRG08_053670 [Elysia crispata]|uniref:Uncharacterized protein n=1 Tax=Elysia crispata TaxID=231223 RepID=A0AAE0ZQP1_9GAST|nr:hypothetical protein RRG08_053670 [Elysia crispata]